MKNSGLPRIVVLAVFLGIIGFTAVGYNAFRKDVAAMRAASLEDITWTSYQLEQELGRFRNSLNRFQIENAGVDAADVNTRFDILWSRIAVFQQGRVGERLAEYDRETQIISRIFDYMKSIDRQVVGLKDTDTATAAELQAQFALFANELREFSRLVTLGEETRGREIREQLQSGVNRTLLLGGVAIFIALISLAYINRESSRYKRLAAINLKLADTAEKASRAKSKFLTMMSHELRTPMNGVLGLLALSKQGSTQQSQIRLLEQAEQSGQKMVGMLADVLDFSSLNSDDLQLEMTPFDLESLKLFVLNETAQTAKREGASIEVSISSDGPKCVNGDFKRIRQAVSHLVEYVIETAGTRNTRLDILFADDALNINLNFEYSSDGGEWTPDLVLGSDDRDSSSFASDALGPAIARGFIEAMKGSIEIGEYDGGRISVLITLPVNEVVSRSPNVSVLANSEAITAICRAALSGDDINFVSDDISDVDIVLIEAGGNSESEFIAQARYNHPNAALIALGKPSNFADFKFSINLPLDFHELRETVSRHIA